METGRERENVEVAEEPWDHLSDECNEILDCARFGADGPAGNLVEMA